MSILSSGCGNRTGKESVNSGLQKPDSERANLIFKEYEHDFGKVAEGEKLGYVFNFENKREICFQFFGAHSPRAVKR